MLLGSLRIDELFQQDFQGLDEQEHSCLRAVSNDAPADFFKIAERYGGTVDRLLNKRLIIRSGMRLNVYWDIFRDYVLTGRVPYIPVTYVPQRDVSSFVRALDFLMEHGPADYDQLAEHLSIAKTTADNIVRELVMLGVAEANRRSFTVASVYDEVEDAEEAIRSFWASHVVYRGLLKELTTSVFSYQQVAVLVPRAFYGVDISDAVASLYAKKIIRWWIALGFVEKFGGTYSVVARPQSDNLLGVAKFAVSRRGRFFFLGESPPKNVREAVDLLASGASRNEVDVACGKNAWAALQNLGLVNASNEYVGELSSDADSVLRAAAQRAPAVKFVSELLRQEGNLKGQVVGERLSEKFGLLWSSGSQKRYGPAVKQWAIWAFDSAPSRPPSLFDNNAGK